MLVCVPLKRYLLSNNLWEKWTERPRHNQNLHANLRVNQPTGRSPLKTDDLNVK